MSWFPIHCVRDSEGAPRRRSGNGRRRRIYQTGLSQRTDGPRPGRGGRGSDRLREQSGPRHCPETDARRLFLRAAGDALADGGHRVANGAGAGLQRGGRGIRRPEPGTRPPRPGIGAHLAPRGLICPRQCHQERHPHRHRRSRQHRQEHPPERPFR